LTEHRYVWLSAVHLNKCRGARRDKTVIALS